MTKPSLTERRYAVCIGINHYSPLSGLSPLHYAEHDARAIDNVLGQLGFSQENRILLCGEQATLEAINTALADVILDKAQTNDLIVLYFAGHSIPLAVKDVDGDAQRHCEVFLTSYDFDRDTLFKSRAFRVQKALGMERIRQTFFEGEGSRKRLFLFDSCYSGDFYGLKYRDEVNPVQGYIRHMLDSTSAGRVALSSCLPIQKATEDPVLQHGRFTYYLLTALEGKAPQALRSDGCVTVNSLFDYVADRLPADQRPVLSGVQQDSFVLACYPELRETKQRRQQVSEDNEQTAKETRLRAMLADHSSFLHDRLSSFVGRQSELADIGQRIREKGLTGGYLTITGQAGQGKSSVIAKLAHDAGPEQVAHHFIPFNPGPDHQVNVLRNLMARLILKYDLSDLYAASDQRAALRDYFPKVLAEVVAKGGQETIFIDGLDQLEEDLNGLRDLSFLPNDLPAGIVLVLGTRPDDTLRPLELLKPLDEYRLPNMSRQDFDLILQHRQVTLERTLADQFYQAMQQNALYLDLIAKELVESDQTSLQDLVARLADNPSNLFSLSIARLKRQPLEWREILKPILGVLLATREPLGLRQIRSILQIEDDRLRDGIQRLGGLLIDTGEQRYALFHLKLHDYLRQNEQLPGKDYIFATDEEEKWHAVLATWCEKGGLSLIWKDVNDSGEQERRWYARHHYIAHLYWARRWQDLFEVLDEGTYGHAKERYDVSTRSYIQDLDFGRRAATWSGWMLEDALEHLPHLWRYTLLRCSLRSRADQYPSELFRLLLTLGQEQEALGQAELLTAPAQKATILQDIAEHLTKQPGRQAESEQLFLRAEEIAYSITESDEQAKVLRALASSLAEAQRWEQAEEVAHSITESDEQARALRALASSLAKAQRWEQAEEVAHSITESDEQARALRALASSLAEAQRWEQAEEVACSITESDEQARALRALASSLAEAQRWEQAERLWMQAEEVAHSITESDEQAEALRALASSLAEAQRWEQAERLWMQAEEVAHSITESYQQAWALRALASSLAEAQRWEQAERLWMQAEEVAHSITESYQQAEALRALASSLAEAQRWEQAERLWMQAEEVAHSITENYQQAWALSVLASSLAEAQRWEQAEEVACSITESDEQAEALNALASSLAEAQRWEQAEEVAYSITESYQQAEALRALASSLAEAQRWEQAERLWMQAEEVAHSITENYQQARALSALASSLAKAQRWEQAEEVAHSITENYQQARALSVLGIALVEKQQWEYAESICTKAEEVAHSITESDKQAEALSALASSLAKAQRWEQAEEVAHSITESDEQAWALSALASSLAEAQRWEQAEEVAHSITESYQQAEALSALASSLAKAQRWEQAEEVAHSITESDEQTEALSVLASSLAEAQRWEQAERLWMQAEGVAHSITESYQQARALSVLASSLAEAQRWEQAERLWMQAEEVAHSITERYEQAWALRALASSLAEAQRWEQAEEVAHSITESDEQAWALSALASSLAEAQRWEQAEEVAHSITESDEQTEALSVLASSLAEAQRWEQAERLWMRAEEVAHSITESDEQTEALSVLASSLAEAQRWEQAERLWMQAEEVAHSITENYQQARALRALASSLAEAQRWEQAEEVAHSITESDEQAEALSALAKVLLEHSDCERVFSLVQRSWLQAETRAFALELFSSAVGLISLKPEFGVAFLQAFKWVDTFLRS